MNTDAPSGREAAGSLQDETHRWVRRAVYRCSSLLIGVHLRYLLLDCLRRCGVPLSRSYGRFPSRCSTRASVIAAEQLILEIKSDVTVLPVHEMQLRTYLRMSGIRVGRLLNFNAPRWL